VKEQEEAVPAVVSGSVMVMSSASSAMGARLEAD